MALTFTKNYEGVVGDRRTWRGTVTFDSSYPTGGEAIAVSDFPGFQVEIEDVIVHSASAATYRPIWDETNSKLKVFVEDGTSGIEAEVADTTDLSSLTVKLQATGF